MRQSVRVAGGGQASVGAIPFIVTRVEKEVDEREGRGSTRKGPSMSAKGLIVAAAGRIPVMSAEVPIVMAV